MSRIPDLGSNMENLPRMLEVYNNTLLEAEAIIELNGKTAEQANKENPAWMLYYDQRKVELYTLVKYLDSDVQRVRGKLFRKFKENHARALNEREINKYIDNEDAYLQKYEIYLEVKEVYEQYQAVVSAFQSRGYALNNITRMRVASIEDALI